MKFNKLYNLIDNKLYNLIEDVFQPASPEEVKERKQISLGDLEETLEIWNDYMTLQYLDVNMDNNTIDIGYFPEMYDPDDYDMFMEALIYELTSNYGVKIINRTHDKDNGAIVLTYEFYE